MVAAPGGVIRLPLEYAMSDPPPAIDGLDMGDPRLWALARCIELPLVRVTPSGELLPGLATGWEQVDNGARWLFSLSDCAEEHSAGELYSALLQRWRVILQGEKLPLREQLADLIVHS